MTEFNPLFDCPAAFEPFYDTRVCVSVHGVPEFTVSASVQLNARETAVAGDRFGDCYSVVFPASAWPLAADPMAGNKFATDTVGALYVYRAQKIESAWHVMACQRVTARR